jgi:hypothetical protein
MPQNFIACDRGQTMLLPPDLMDWVPDDHLAWSMLGAVDQMDLSAVFVAYRENGQGRAAYELRQAGFDGDLDSRVLSLGRGRLQADAPSEEVPARVA